MFISIAEYFGINYETLYENIPSVYREELVRELDQKYSMLKKKRIRKLF
jgi:lysine/ornithine N-monooxygenase